MQPTIASALRFISLLSTRHVSSEVMTGLKPKMSRLSPCLPVSFIM